MAQRNQTSTGEVITVNYNNVITKMWGKINSKCFSVHSRGLSTYFWVWYVLTECSCNTLLSWTDKAETCLKESEKLLLECTEGAHEDNSISLECLRDIKITSKSISQQLSGWECEEILLSLCCWSFTVVWIVYICHHHAWKFNYVWSNRSPFLFS